MNQFHFRRQQRGFSIIEALISLVIMGFGILALAGMHAALTRSADHARQQTEALRLAQEKIEELRSFTGISSTVGGTGSVLANARNWDTLATSISTSDTVTTNVTYSRSWTFGGAISDAMRSLAVTVDWTDRTGTSQQVILSSVLSKTNPSDSGFLGFPLPLNTNLKRPKDRNLDIPIKAIDIGGGESALRFGTGGQYVVFGNISGDVVKICTPTGLTSTSTDAQVTTTLHSQQDAHCTEVQGYIVTGYIARGSVQNTTWTAIKSSLGINTAAVVQHASSATAISCYVEDAVNQNTGALIADQKSYLCVVPVGTPDDTDVHAADFPQDPHWLGKMKISGPSAGWANGAYGLIVCQYDYAANSSLMNTTTREYYPQNKSIDQQNFLITSASSCPSSMTVSSVSTGRLHQDCRSSNASVSQDCPSITPTATYRVTYDANQGTGTVPTDTASYASGAAVTMPSASALSRSNYTFNGWSESNVGSATVYSVGSSFTMPSSNVTLYAQWRAAAPATTYTVTYDGNGNTGGTAPVASGSPYAAGSTISVLSQGTLVKSGATFVGWNTQSNGSGTSYSAGNSVGLTGNLTLYAQWTVALAAPSASWPGTSTTSPRTLTWSAVPNATAYEVRSCVLTNTNSNSTCTPTSADPSQTVRTKEPPTTMQPKEMYCYNVTATTTTSGYTTSAASGTYCIYRKQNGDYTYSP